MVVVNQKTLNKKLAKELTGKGPLQLARIADNVSYKETCKQVKDEEGNKFNLPRYRVRIVGHQTEEGPTIKLPWAYSQSSTGNPAVCTGNAFLMKNTWVYVYQDPDSGEYFIERVGQNTLKKLSAEESGFDTGSTYLLIPDNMYLDGKIPDGAEVYNSQVPSEIDLKAVSSEDKAKLYFPPWCDAAKTESPMVGIDIGVENAVKVNEKLEKITKPFNEIKKALDDASKNIIGDKDDQLGIFNTGRENQYTISAFNNSVKIYQKNLKLAAKDIAKWIRSLLKKLKTKFKRRFTLIANGLKGFIPASGRFVANDLSAKGAKAISCFWNAIMDRLEDMIWNSLFSFLGKVVNTTTCLIENFVGGFLGQLLGQVSALITSVLSGITNAINLASGFVGAGIDFLNAIGDVLENLLSILKCEFKYCIEEDKVVRWELKNGAFSKGKKLDLANVWNKAKKVGEKFRDLTDVTEDVENFDFNIDVDDLLDDALDLNNCDTGPVFCGVPDIVIWGGGGSGATGNPVINFVGELIGVDITLPGQGYENGAPLIEIDDKCRNGNGGTGRVFVGPITGIGEVGVTTGGGIGGDIGDLDDGTTGGQFGQGTTAGIGITYHVTVNAVAAGNRYFIDDKQQRTLTFDRGNTYILNQEHVSNNGHPLRFSETKDGTHGGGVEYTRGVTIDGIPGLGESATDTAYSRIVVNNNTPDRLYYYCEVHPKMGGVINITGTTDEELPDGTTLPSIIDGTNATVEISAVNNSGGVIAVKNLKGGTGYNECMANVSTHGGAGTGFTIKIVKTNGGAIEAISLNNKGTSYQVGDIVTIVARTIKKTITTTSTTIGVTKVLITNSGSGYLPSPDGSKGGMNRTWATRCQTIVRRKNLDWDAPYSEGDIITLYAGDWIELPGKSRVYIDENFDESKLLGAQVTGVSVYVPQDMTNFPISSKLQKKFLDTTFTTATLIDSFAPDGLFDWPNQYGVERIDGTSPDATGILADYNFYAGGEYLGQFIQNSVTEDPQIRIGDVSYRLGVQKSYDPPDPFDYQIPWVRAADVLPQTSWVLTASQGWSTFLKNYGVYPSTQDPQYQIIGTMSATWRVATFVPGRYTFEMQADNVGTIYWDGVKLGSTQPYAGHNRNLKFQFYAGEIEPAIHEIKVEIENKIHRDGRTAVDYTSIEQNPAAVAWVLKDPGGTIIKTSLDEFGVPGFADILYGYNSYFSIKAYNVSTKLDTPEDNEWFDCETDYKSARLLGFTDCDIRHFLENNPDIALDACMLAKLNDKNWGKCDGDLMVSLTAPGCPPPPCLPNNTYPVIVCLDEIFVENTGFGFDPCKDTVKIEPANGAKAEIDVSVDGGIRSIRVTDCGSGFTELPEISINTKTGYNAILKPIMKFHRPGEIDVPKGTSVIQVVDCVGKVV